MNLFFVLVSSYLFLNFSKRVVFVENLIKKFKFQISWAHFHLSESSDSPVAGVFFYSARWIFVTIKSRSIWGKSCGDNSIPSSSVFLPTNALTKRSWGAESFQSIPTYKLYSLSWVMCQFLFVFWELDFHKTFASQIWSSGGKE